MNLRVLKKILEFLRLKSSSIYLKVIKYHSMREIFPQLVAFSLIFLLMASTVTAASAAKTNSRLTLDSLPATAYGGDKITFSGELTTAFGDSISGATIYIKDDDTLGFDDLIAKTTTNSNGKYIVTAVVKDWDKWSQASEIYAIFEGSSNYGKSRSSTYDVYVVEEKPSQIKQAAPQTTTTSQTRLILDHIKTSSAYVDDTIKFTGQLTSNGKPVSGKTIYIKEDDPIIRDKTLFSGTTNSNGKFSINWTIKNASVFEKDFDIYATFEGDKNYKKSRSANQIVSILKYITYISMNKVPSTVSVGDTITFKGKLQFEKGSPKGAVVYIKDEDTANPDDLLVTAYVESDGTFAANWIVRNTDFDRELEIYAVFEGTRQLYRTTTCDDGPTLDIGGRCQNTMKMYVNQAEITTSPVLGSDEYFDLYYSLSFSKNPVIAIVPSPDDYTLTKRSVVPSQEGILMWKSKLDQKYGGNWNVDFIVVEPDSAFWNTKPDIVINIVSHETEGSCGVDWSGLAIANGIKPIQTFVCATSQKNPRTPSSVASTAAHEFIHALGLGHAFNIDRDMMCSIENNRETCSTISKSKTPSDFSTAAVVALYGADGFRSPNTKVPYSGAKFTVNDYYKITNGEEFGTKTNLPSTTNTANDQCKQHQCIGGKLKTELDLEFQYEFTTSVKKIKSGQNVCFDVDLLNPSISGGKYLVENRLVKLLAERFDKFGNQAYLPLQLSGRTDSYGDATICHEHTLSEKYDYLEYRYTAYFDGDEKYTKSNSNILLLEITNTITPPTKINLDSDNDGIVNSLDNCASIANKNQKDSDLDGLGDVCDDDFDNDGILNHVDKCAYNKETYNGYQDSDGCPDTKPDQFKQKSFLEQNKVNTLILKTQPNLISTQEKLYATYYHNSQAQAEVNKAWTSSWWATKYFNDAIIVQAEGANYISKSNYEFGFYKYDYAYNALQKSEKYIAEINQHLNNAYNIANN
mgnify:CR=1 FL=1